MYPPFNPYRFVKAENETHHWHGGSALRTQYFNALSMCFPELERRMIHSVRTTVGTCGDRPPVRALQGRALDFIAQEASHSQVHSRLNTHRVNPSWPVLVNLWPKQLIARRHWLSNLARTCAIEHFTTLLAVYLFRHPALFSHVPPDIRDLWLWHAAEEIENRSLALDLYRAAEGGYVRRIGYFLLIFVTANLMVLAQTLSNLAHDRQVFKARTWQDALALFWGRQGLAWFIVRHLPAYLQPGYSPNDHHREECDAAMRWLSAHRRSRQETASGESRMHHATSPSDETVQGN